MNYEYGHLTEELLLLIPDKPMTIADSFGDSKAARRLRTMIGACGDMAVCAYHEACLVKCRVERLKQLDTKQVARELSEAEGDFQSVSAGGMACDLGVMNMDDYTCMWCGVGDILPSGRCSHCNLNRNRE